MKKISLVHLVPDVAASSHVTGMLMINEQKSLYIQENFTLLCINHGTKASFEGFFLMALILQNEFNQFFNHSYNGMPDALKHLLTPTWTCLVCSERQGWMTWDWAYTNTQEITEQCNFCIHWEYLRIGKSFHWSGNDCRYLSGKYSESFSKLLTFIKFYSHWIYGSSLKYYL